MRKLIESKKITATLGVVSGYFHSNNADDIYLSVTTIIQEASELYAQLHPELPYISMVATPSVTTYRKEWGCPDGGELTFTISSVANPTFVTDLKEWEDTARGVFMLIQRQLKQSTMLIEVQSTSVDYNKSLLEGVSVVLAPSKELAEVISPHISIEAEYGDYCIPGALLTLAHHGSRSGRHNAPCNAQISEEILGNIEKIRSDSGLVVLVSHLDADTIGGIINCILPELYVSIKSSFPGFWEGLEYVDVWGIHHLHDLEEDVQKHITCYNMIAQKFRRQYSRNESTNVTSDVENLIYILLEMLFEKDSSLYKVASKMNDENIRKIESSLIKENKKLRMFNGDVFTAASYYSPKMDAVVPVTVSRNTATGAITLAFEDGGKKYSASNIMQELFGDKAGGRAGIAGTPRGESFSLEDLEKLGEYINKLEF